MQHSTTQHTILQQVVTAMFVRPARIYIWRFLVKRYKARKGRAWQEKGQGSSKGGAVETGCSGLHYIIGSFIIQYFPHPLYPPPTAPPFDEYPKGSAWLEVKTKRAVPPLGPCEISLQGVWGRTPRSMSQDSSKGGAVETGCSDLCDVIH